MSLPRVIDRDQTYRLAWVDRPAVVIMAMADLPEAGA